MNCRDCSAAVTDEAKFCSRCGTKIYGVSAEGHQGGIEAPPRLPRVRSIDWDQEEPPEPPPASREIASFRASLEEKQKQKREGRAGRSK